jgi:perosamine synthetase
MKYIINKPNLSSLELKYVSNALKSTWLSSNGTNTKIFEKKFSKFLNTKFSLAVQSGTAALHLALVALGVNKSDCVIVPNYTCSANISSVSQCNALPILVDVESETFGLDFELVKKAILKYKPKVLQLVHVYGFPARDTLKIIKFCKKKNVKVIEDISESLGAEINNKKVGNFGVVSVCSVRSEKMIGVGEGGVISANKDDIFKKIKLIASRAAIYRGKEHPYWKKYFVCGEGYNYLMPHLLGSLGRAQIERFKTKLLKKKINVGILYRNNFNIKNIEIAQKTFKNSKPVYWLNSIFFKKLSKHKVREIGQTLMRSGLEVRSGFWPLNKFKNFKSIYLTKNNISEKIFNKLLVLPSSYDLKKEDISIIQNKIKKILNED